MGVLSGLEPESVFRYFEEIAGIPHGSGDTKQISDYCAQFAKERGLRYIQDVNNNLIIWKEGTPGYENSEPVLLQGHMDMVCEKEDGCEIDFHTDGLSLVLKDGVITADGTTLGGDDGIAIAYCLAILDADDIAHPPLEVVFTVDEEIGMLGAAALDLSPLKARKMLNLDSEEEGYLLVSCAGGVTSTGHLPVLREEYAGIPITLTVTGLLGGHSGVEIDKGRANACMLLGRVLYQLQQAASFRLVTVQGGLKDNAIPRQAKAALVVGNEKDVEAIRQRTNELATILRQEYRATDPDVELFVKAEETKSAKESFLPMNTQATQAVITALVNLPWGIQRMSFDIEGLVETSLNLGILNTEETEVSYSFAVRSSVETEKQELVSRIECLMKALGGYVTNVGEYPAWEYLEKSPLRDIMTEVFEKQYGRKPVVQALHAGVECGLFAGKLDGLDAVSFGPDMKDIHTPKESMDVGSVRRTWEYLLEILKNLR